MDDIDALFDSIDGWKEDLMDFGVAGIGAVGGNLLYGYLDSQVVAQLPFVGTTPWARSALAIAAGVAGGAVLSRYSKNLATGVAVGLAARGVAGLLNAFAPNLAQQLNPTATAGLGLTYDEQRLLVPGAMAAAPSFVEEVNGYGGATTTADQVSGLGQYGQTTRTVEEVHGFAGLAATLQ